jgi:2-C-methyl-D-erythritol 4-phosphate cytidylyltransferase
MIPPDALAAIVVAAGESRRFGGDKLFCRLDNRAVLSWSLDVLDASPLVSLIVLVLNQANLEQGRRLVARRGYRKVRAICLGGARRQDSVWNGLQQAAGWNWVAIQDGARPFLTPDLLDRGLDVAREIGGAVAAVPVKDTIKVVEEANLIERTPSRAHLWAAQTPQIFRYDRLAEAYRLCNGVDVTDDAELMERAGLPVAVYMGSYDNLKITTAEDLALASLIARRRRCR